MAEAGVASETFEAPVEPEGLDVVQDRLAAFWSHDETVSPADRMRFELAVAEVVANIVEHAFVLDADRRGRMLTVALTLSPDQVEAVLSDNGVPAAIDLGAVTMPDEDATSGRGLARTDHTVDEGGYERADVGNQCKDLCTPCDV
jgi:serine/threonine-protein kinase RsbW